MCRASITAALRRWDLVALFGILLAASAMRFAGLDWGMPQLFHPDEWRVLDLARFSAREIGIGSDYGALPVILLRCVAFLVELLPGSYSLSAPESLVPSFLIGRALSASFEVGCVALVFVLGKRAFGAAVGLVAAALLAFAPVHIQQAHFATVDSALGFFALLALVACLQLAQDPRRSTYLLAGAALGAAVASKFTAVVLLPVLVLAHILANWPDRLRRLLWGEPALRLVASLGVSALLFLVLTPHAILQPGEYWGLDFADPRWWHAWNFPEGTNRLLWNLLMTRHILRPLWSLSSAEVIPYLYPICGIIPNAMGFLALPAAAGGIVTALVRNRGKATLLLLGYCLCCVVLLGGARPFFARYLVMFCPVLAVFAARFVLLEKLPRALRALASLIVVGWSAMQGLAFTGIYLQDDARVQAASWIDHNVPTGSVIAWEVDRFWAPFRWDQADPRVRIVRWDLYNLYDSSTPHVYPSGLLGWMVERLLAPPRNHGQLTQGEIQQALDYPLRQADYVVLSNRFLDQYRSARPRFPLENRFYDGLFDGTAGFVLLRKFRVTPTLFGIEFDDEDTEHMFRVDHPTLWVFKRKGQVVSGVADHG